MLATQEQYEDGSATENERLRWAGTNDCHMTTNGATEKSYSSDLWLLGERTTNNLARSVYLRLKYNICRYRQSVQK